MNGKYEYWLASLPGIAGRMKVQLLEFFDTEEEIYKAAEYGMEKLHMIPENIKEAMKNAKRKGSLERSYENFCRTNIKLVCWRDREYPEKLRNIYDMPYGLFIKGRLPTQEQKMVAVVGARSCSYYGQGVAEQIGTALSGHGVGVVSGLAYGIDAAAHTGAIKRKGNTYAVMGCGVDICYPEANRSLYQRITEHGGIISEYDMGCEPRKIFFPMRNRIISALSDAVIVVEAKKRSGSLITADCAMEQGKLVYAVPGRIHDSLSYGTNWLLSQGAAPFYSMEEFLKELGLEKKKDSLPEKIMEFPLEKNERLVYSVLDLTPKHLEDIMEETGLPFTETVYVLSGLQRKKMIKEIYKNYYIKTGVL